MAETVESVVKQVAAGKMDAAEAGRKIAGLVTRVAPPGNEAERMRRYEESYNEAAIETDPNNFRHVLTQYYLGNITKAQLETIQQAMHGETKLSEGTEYYLTENQHAARKVEGGPLEVFTADGKWVTSDVENFSECSEEEALAAAKRVWSLGQ